MKIIVYVMCLLGAMCLPGASSEIFESVKDKLVIVECHDSTGSGFILEMEQGKKYFVTNKHVVEGQDRVAAILLNGKSVPLGKMSVAKNRDLVRFEVDSKCPALSLKEGEPNIDEEIYVFGNSDGSGVATDLTGKIIGVGPAEIEVDAKFVAGNSGSAVLNSEGQVVGVATYAALRGSPDEWVKKDTRFKDIRRFAVRLVNVEWEETTLQKYYKQVVAEIEAENKKHGVLPQVTARFVSPKVYSPSALHICGDITLTLSGGGSEIKNPLVRVCVLVKTDSGYHMLECIMDEIGSHSTRKCPPVYGYGCPQDGWCYSIGNGNYVYYLEGLSYWQKVLPVNTKRVGIKYFTKTRGAWESNLFYLRKIVCRNKPVEIAAFRLECWQNGALAGCYDSKSPSQLNSRKIPVDWFKTGKYQGRIEYLGNLK